LNNEKENNIINLIERVAKIQFANRFFAIIILSLLSYNYIDYTKVKKKIKKNCNIYIRFEHKSLLTLLSIYI